ncbi:MAG TPA: hypothetical protein VF490_20375 [Chryseosolibacter sp.]
MKSLAFILISGLMALNPACAQKVDDITRITLTKQSRGYFDEVVISRDSVRGSIENHRSPQNSRNYAVKIDEEDWAKVVMTLNDLSLKDIDGLQSPTMERARDAALHSSIVIAFKDGTTVSHSFDDENPHRDLKPLLEAINQLRVPDVRK